MKIRFPKKQKQITSYFDGKMVTTKSCKCPVCGSTNAITDGRIIVCSVKCGVHQIVKVR